MSALRGSRPPPPAVITTKNQRPAGPDFTGGRGRSLWDGTAAACGSESYHHSSPQFKTGAGGCAGRHTPRHTHILKLPLALPHTCGLEAVARQDEVAKHVAQRAPAHDVDEACADVHGRRRWEGGGRRPAERLLASRGTQRGLCPRHPHPYAPAETGRERMRAPTKARGVAGLGDEGGGLLQVICRGAARRGAASAQIG